MKLGLTITIAVLGIVIGSVLSAIPVMFLWNWLVPSIFGLKAISFLEALGLSALCSILFKSSSSSTSAD